MERILNITKLYTERPTSQITGEFQSILMTKIQTRFSLKEQQMYMAGLHCSRKYDTHNDFIVDLSDTWKWVGFRRIEPAKKLLLKKFTEGVDYKKFDAGPKEVFRLTITCFLKLCLSAGTARSKEFHEYYVKLEIITNEVAEEKCDGLREQLAKS
jgi:hypothetical protein